MPDFQTIVAAVDAAEPAREILRLAETLTAAVPGSTRHVLHAVPPIPASLHESLFPFACVGDDEDALLAELREIAARRTADIVSRHWKGVAAADLVRVANGTPADTVLELADGLGPDILLIGSTEGAVRQPGLLGSTAERCLRRARLPILLVHRSGTPTPRRIAVAVDLTADSRPLLERALLLAHGLKAQVLPITVLPHVADLDHAGLLPQGDGVPGRVRKEVEKRMQQQLSQIELPFAVRSGADEQLLPPVFGVGDPARTVLQHAEEAAADLLVIGRARSGSPVTALGRTAEHVARNSHAHVLVLPLAAGGGSP